MLLVISAVTYAAPIKPAPIYKTIWNTIVEHWKSWICG